MYDVNIWFITIKDVFIHEIELEFHKNNKIHVYYIFMHIIASVNWLVAIYYKGIKKRKLYNNKTLKKVLIR